MLTGDTTLRPESWNWGTKSNRPVQVESRGLDTVVLPLVFYLLSFRHQWIVM